MYFTLSKDTILRIKPDSKYFSNKVMEVYESYLRSPERFIVTKSYLILPNSTLRVWAANDISHRKFEIENMCIESDLLFNENNVFTEIQEIKEINNNLTYYDKLLLDKIIISAQKYQDTTSKILFTDSVVA